MILRVNGRDDTVDADSPVRVLHVDDSREFRELAAAFLERVGPFDVVSEPTPAAGLSRLRTDDVDCVVSDFDMPTTDGLSFFAQVADFDPTLPFILFTGKGSEEIASEAISAGITDYVRKRGGRDQYEMLGNRITNAVERARATARSRETTARMRESFDRITDSFLSVDAEWRVTFVNEQAAAFLDTPAEDLLGADLRALSSDGTMRFHEEYAEALRTGEPVSFEAEPLGDPDRWLDVRAYPADDGLSIYWRDVTAARRRERRLAALHDSARSLLTGDTVDDICRRAVDVVESVLGFEAACVQRVEDVDPSAGDEQATPVVRPVATGSSPPESARLASAAAGTFLGAVAARDDPVVVRAETDVTAVLPSVTAADPDPGVYLPVGDDRVLVARDAAGDVEAFDVHCLRLLATTVETALSRLGDERDRRANRNAIRALHGSAAELRSRESVEAVLDVALRSARDVVSFDRCLVARHKGGTLRRVAQSGDLPAPDDRLPVSCGVAERAYRTGESVLVDDAATHDDVTTPSPFGSILTVPLGEWGVFQAVSETVGAFDDADRELAELLVTHVQAALSRVESDDALRRERDLLAAFFESSGEPVVRVRFEDCTPHIDRVNPAFERTFGVDAASVRNDPLHAHVGSPDADASTHPFTDPQDGEPVEAEVARLTEQGRREFLFRSVPFRGEGGTPMAYGIYVDITTRKQRERELERYRTIVESTGDPVYTLDADGVITYVNDAIEAMTGYDADELVGEHIGLLVPDADVARSEQLIASLLSAPDRANDTVELDLLRVDGSRVRCEVHIALLPSTDGFVGTAGAIRDITARQERKRELEAQNERLDRFASVVSHDLRNPLQIAQGNLALARERRDDADEELARVGSALDRIDEIVDSVLTLAREGTALADPVDVPVADVARRAWASVETPNAALSVETDRVVRGDARRLRRLFENLFRNSVEHRAGGDPATTGDGERESVTVRLGHVDRGEPCLFVEDDGPGIPAAERDRVFEPGYSTTDDGTGFGLDIVAEIADAHGWETTLTDGDRGGARFEFRLPPA